MTVLAESTLTAPAIADLVVLDADPLTGIGDSRGIHAVVREGRLHSRSDLDRMPGEVRAVAGGSGPR